jgi:hypothetical protein
MVWAGPKRAQIGEAQDEGSRQALPTVWFRLVRAASQRQCVQAAVVRREGRVLDRRPSKNGAPCRYLRTRLGRAAQWAACPNCGSQKVKSDRSRHFRPSVAITSQQQGTSPPPAPSAPPTSPLSVPPAWVADPLGRHELRWWDGSRWTKHVSDSGVVSNEAL